MSVAVAHAFGNAAIGPHARPRRQRKIIDSNIVFHNVMVKYWKTEERDYLRETRIIPNRIEQVASALKSRSQTHGDALVAKIKDVFHNGFGIKFGDDQIRVYNAFIKSCLPLIYGETWGEEKTRVLAEWGMDREAMYSLVNMARRNGKTFVTSATAAAILLCVPNVKIAIFSTCKRTSQMMMEATMEKLEMAFERGTHVNRQDYAVITKNMESVCYECNGTKRMLGSFPGSVRVSNLLFVSWWVGGSRHMQVRKKCWFDFWILGPHIILVRIIHKTCNKSCDVATDQALTKQEKCQCRFPSFFVKELFPGTLEAAKI